MLRVSLYTYRDTLRSTTHIFSLLKGHKNVSGNWTQTELTNTSMVIYTHGTKSKSGKSGIFVPGAGPRVWKLWLVFFSFPFTHFLNLCLQLRLTAVSAQTAVKNAFLSFFRTLVAEKREEVQGGEKKKKQTKALFRKCPGSQTHPLVRSYSRCRNFPSFTQDEGGDKSAWGEEASALVVRPGPLSCRGRAQTNSPTRFCLFLSLSLPPSLSFLPPSLSTGTHTLPVALGEK